MRALTFGTDGRFHTDELPDPEVPEGGLVVRVSACGICGSDLHMVEAGIVPAGAVLGHEAAGVVEAVADGVHGLRPGDAVAIHPFDPCGTCPACTSGAPQRCHTNAMTTIGLGYRQGAYAERVALTPGMVHRLPDGFPSELGALAEPLAVAYHGFERSRFESGMSVGVIGCGPIGLSAVMCARALGAGEVWASDSNAFRAELAVTAGADRAGRNPRDADIVVECAGAPGTIDLAVSSTHGGGQVVVLAVNVRGDQVWPFVWVTKEVEIVPCLGYTRAEYDAAAEMISSGRVDVAPIITRRAGLEEADEAFFSLLAGAAEGKVLVTP